MAREIQYNAAPAITGAIAFVRIHLDYVDIISDKPEMTK